MSRGLRNAQGNGRLGTDSRRAGFTLHEMAIYITVLSLLMSPLVTVVVSSAETAAEADTLHSVQERNRVALFRMADDFRTAMSSTVEIALSGRALRFVVPTEFDGTAISGGETILYTFEPVARNEATQEITGRLVRRNMTTEEAQVMCENVDMSQALFEVDGNGIKITMATTGDADKGAINVTKSVTIYAYN